jgi:hypothetical protein
MAVRGRDQVALESLALLHLAEPSAQDDGTPAAPGASLVDHARHPGRRNRHDQRVNGHRQIAHRWNARVPHSGPPEWVHAPYLAPVAQRSEVHKSLVAVAARPVAGADDGH